MTNRETGPAEEKPAVIVHAQIHAMEFTGTTAALTLLDRLLHGYGEDEKVTAALDTRTFYVVPRVNPDGAEAGLADGRFRRSSVRPYPREELQDGLHREDVDGDGRVLMMRQRDPNGPGSRIRTTLACSSRAGRTTSRATSTASSRRGRSRTGTVSRSRSPRPSKGST